MAHYSAMKMYRSVWVEFKNIIPRKNNTKQYTLYDYIYRKSTQKCTYFSVFNRDCGYLAKGR